MTSTSPSSYLAPVLSHFDRILSTGLANYGPNPTRMWLSCLDLYTGKYPVNDQHPPEIGKRVYRNIDAPKGCSLYWDQPSLVAAYALSFITGKEQYARSAQGYLEDFLENCVAKNGIFLWGNHYYFSVETGKVMKFHAEEQPVPVDQDLEEGELHEIRPLPPAWELTWRINSVKTAAAIDVASQKHLADGATGEFNRHAEASTGCSFPEAGGILVQSLAWLFNKNGDRSLIDRARKIALFSYRYRDPITGLMEINPTWARWDKTTCTSEVGLWAGCLINAAGLANVTEWIDMADQTIKAWLKFSYSDTQRKYYGRLRTSSGVPILGAKETPYQPGDFCDLWEPLFPAHDYPMPLAEACLKLFQITGNPVYRLACRRWAEVIQLTLPARAGRGGYAEHYGRCIHFCYQAWKVLGDSDYLSLAQRLADEAMSVLFTNGMFRGHPGEDRYDAVDGVGFLALALIELSTGSPSDMMGMSW